MPEKAVTAYFKIQISQNLPGAAEKNDKTSQSGWRGHRSDIRTRDLPRTAGLLRIRLLFRDKIFRQTAPANIVPTTLSNAIRLLYKLSLYLLRLRYIQFPRSTTAFR
jgi:hypothetical protein